MKIPKFKFLFILCLLVFLYSECVVSADPIFKVGVVLPLSGDAASAGQAVKNGIDLAYQELRSEQKSKIKIFYEDDALQAKNSISSFNKLRNIEGINVLINATSGTGNALAALAEDGQVTFISIASDPEISRNRKYVFNFWISAEDEVEAVFPEVAKRGYKKVALFSTIHSGTLTIKNAFIQKNNGRLDVVVDQDLDPNIRDFRPFLTKLRAVKDLDAIQLILIPGQVGLFAKQARQLGLNMDLFSYELFEDPAEVRASAGALIGQWYAQGYDGEPAFVERYQQKFPNQSMWGAANGHDAIRLITAALEQGVPSAEFNKFLYDLKDFKGALGVYSSNRKNWFTLPVILKAVSKNGFDRLYP